MVSTGVEMKPVEQPKPEEKSLNGKIVDELASKSVLKGKERSEAWTWIQSLDDGNKELLLQLLVKAEKIDSAELEKIRGKFK